VARNISLAEAKAKLSECIQEAERGEPVVITRYGKPVAALVGAEELERLDRLRAAGPGAGLAGLAGGWEGSEELADALDRRSRDRRTRHEG